MPKLFFLVRWWPWFSATFPFDDFAEVADEDIPRALEEFAVKYAREHSDAVMKAREARVARHRAIDQGQPMRSFDAGRPRPSYEARSLKERPASWRELSEEFRWVSRQMLLVGDEAKVGYCPTPWKVFYAIEDHPASTTVLDVVRKHRSPQHGVYTWRVDHKAKLHPVDQVSRLKAIEELAASVGSGRPLMADQAARMLRTFEYAHAAKSNTGVWLRELYQEAETAEAIIARDQNEDASESRHTDTRRARGSSGRPAVDPALDRRLSEAWATKQHGSKKDLARAFDLSIKQVKAALDRHRKRPPK